MHSKENGTQQHVLLVCGVGLHVYWPFGTNALSHSIAPTHGQTERNARVNVVSEHVSSLADILVLVGGAILPAPAVPASRYLLWLLCEPFLKRFTVHP